LYLNLLRDAQRDGAKKPAARNSAAQRAATGLKDEFNGSKNCVTVKLLF
jgi:hypothetical protein